jgi:hypothetical protein
LVILRHLLGAQALVALGARRLDPQFTYPSSWVIGNAGTCTDAGSRQLVEYDRLAKILNTIYHTQLDAKPGRDLAEPSQVPPLQYHVL